MHRLKGGGVDDLEAARSASSKVSVLELAGVGVGPGSAS
jgi:hypothetical protein